MKKYKILAHLYFLTLIIFSIVYYKQRVIYIDSAAQIFEIINNETFAIYVKRYSMFISQLFPILMIKIGLPLKSIIIAYSVSFILIAYFSFWLSFNKLKNKFSIIIFPLIIIGIRLTFFHAISETFQALAFSTILFAFIYYIDEKKFAKKYLFVGIFIFLIFLNMFIHLVTFFTILFILGFYLVDRKKWKKLEIYLYIGLVLIIFSLKTILVAQVSSSHDSQFINELQNFKEIILNFWTTYTFKFPFLRFRKIYFIPFLMLCIVIYFYLKQKEYLKLIYVLAFISVFYLVSVIVYHKGDSDIGMERTFLPLVFFIIIPFSQIVINNKSKVLDYAFFSIIAFSLLFSFIGISKTQKILKKRTDYIYTLTEINKNKKTVLESDFANTDILKTTWGLGIESLLLSSIDNNSNTIFYNFDSTKVEIENSNNIFFCVPWDVRWQQNSLNKKYFNLPDTSYNYFKTNISDNKKLSKIYFCGLEEMKANKTQYSEIDTIYFYPETTDIYSYDAFEGKNSIKLNNNSPFGLTFFLKDLRYLDYFEITVRRKGCKNSFIVAQHLKNKIFYINSNLSNKIDSSEWEKMQLEFFINKDLENDSIKIYLWNPDSEAALFDNLIIKKYSFN